MSTKGPRAAGFFAIDCGSSPPADIASATSSKSESGLIDVIVAAKKEVLAAARAAGSITAERENAIAASLHKRVGKLVKRNFAGPARAR